MLEDVTTEPHAQEISADIVRVWLSGYILQQQMCVCVCVCVRTHGVGIGCSFFFSMRC